ncbi:MAG: HEAT repeat domain-containing protein [Geminocystis sp.]|nr:HEAT repeat domain-containing protein [Geminocystis sp.]HIK38230.1 HEAT repeat domain-containing protein [Geminocystis sp. M7585_C2015_104]MCS7149071.1 HEAT repeat domain-containing protein [Geminocystis sp.]MCX8078126.1 HEAT repeat domain-containing protein [Geminocystis sp.]MDW8117148.1 HEAT repeat domain-containing protein [Geminocystis sp.]
MYITGNSTEKVQRLVEAVRKADSADALLKAVEELAAVKSPQAIPILIEVLGWNNPGAAVAAVDGLIAIGAPAVEPLLQNIDDYNYGARAWALRVLAGIGDIRAKDLLISAATTDFSQSVRRAATRGLGNLKWQQLPAEEKFNTQQEIFNTLLTTIGDGEWVVRYATVVAWENFYLALKADSGSLDLLAAISEELKTVCARDNEIAIQTRAKLALNRIQAGM